MTNKDRLGIIIWFWALGLLILHEDFFFFVVSCVLAIIATLILGFGKND